MRYPLWIVVFAACCVIEQAAAARTFTIREPFGLAWGPDRVSYRVEFPKGAAVPDGLSLRDRRGNPVAVQLSDTILWPDKKTVRSAVLSFMATLEPDEVGQWTLVHGVVPVAPPRSDLVVVESADAIELSTSKVAIRLPSGAKTFETPVPAGQLPAPILGVRIGGQWVGRGWWQTERPCVGYSAKLQAKGPVFARVALQYEFVDKTFYKATIELAAGQDVAVVSEEFNLSEGQRYEMPELGGVRPGDTFQYVLPRFASKEQAMMWDWWCQTHGRVPSPNAYYFSFYAGLQPDSCEWAGRMYHEAAKPGDGGLAYAKDSRVISLNAYLQWGEDESLYFGAYNSKNPGDELAIIALRPSQWLHPDINPHPIKTLVQYVQTNNLWIERRTAPDLYLRAPVCLGKRVYGIGVLERKEQTLPDGKKAIGSEIMLRHVRLGRLELDTVKDWVLDYTETSKYPRLFVEEGDRAHMAARVKKNLSDHQHLTWVRYYCTGDPKLGAKVIEEAMDGLRAFVHQFATSDYGHMMYAINTGMLAHQAEAALSVPEITPAQRATILRFIAANLYNSLLPDYVPPREAGFAWGSANMMSQLRARAALMAALLPNHPEGRKWRSYLTEWLTLYAQSQINPHGATLECPHYSGMVFEEGIIPLLAMSRCGGKVDMSRAYERYRAAGRVRIGTLLPWDLRGGFRSTPPIGDGYYEVEFTSAILAALFEREDPRLAAEFLWAVSESGRSFGGHPTPVGVLLDADKPAAVPDLRSESYPGMGFVMRNGFPRRDETFLLVTAGSFSVGHGHSDRGAFIFYAKGAPLMVDFAAMYTPSMAEAWLHPGGLSFNHDEAVKPCPGRDRPGCYFTGKVWMDHKVEPFTCLEPGWDPDAKDLDEAFGVVRGFVTFPTADYAEMTRPIRYLNRVPYMLPEKHGQLLTRGAAEDVWVKRPFVWTRRYVLVKSADPMSHNYLVFRDDLAGNEELVPALDLWCLANTVDVAGQTVAYTGQHGIDLDAYIAEPSSFVPLTRRVGHGCGFGFAQYYQKTFGKPFVEEQILCQVPQAPGNGGYFVALVPRKHEETPPTFATVLDGRAIQVAFRDRTDTIVLLDQPGQVASEGLTLDGTAFVLTKAGGKLSVTMLAPGAVKKGKKTLLKKPGTVESGL